MTNVSMTCNVTYRDVLTYANAEIYVMTHSWPISTFQNVVDWPVSNRNRSVAGASIQLTISAGKLLCLCDRSRSIDANL